MLANGVPSLALHQECGLHCVSRAEATCGAKVRKIWCLCLIPPYRIETIIDQGDKTKHSEIAEMVDKLFQDPSKITTKVSHLSVALVRAPLLMYGTVQITPENVDTCYSPIIQSGGVYDLRPSCTRYGGFTVLLHFVAFTQGMSYTSAVLVECVFFVLARRYLSSLSARGSICCCCHETNL
jgi:hypothetical protein